MDRAKIVDRVICGLRFAHLYFWLIILIKEDPFSANPSFIFLELSGSKLRLKGGGEARKSQFTVGFIFIGNLREASPLLLLPINATCCCQKPCRAHPGSCTR